MDKYPIANAQNDSVTPFGWEVYVQGKGDQLVLVAWDLSHPESPRNASEGRIDIQRADILDVKGEAPETLAQSIVNALAEALTNFRPEQEERSVLTRRVTTWIQSCRESSVGHDT